MDAEIGTHNGIIIVRTELYGALRWDIRVAERIIVYVL